MIADDAGYDDARTIFNSMIDRRPAYVARCADADDVVSALAFGRRRGLPISVRSGGHSVAGNSLVEDGLVVDMRDIKPSSSIPTRARPPSAGARPGGTRSRRRATWAGDHRRPRLHDRRGGLTLGGGSGWFERKFGLACDNLISVETRDGGRPPGDRERGREPRAVLGASRWRRQLRDRDLVRVPPASAAGRDARHAALLGGPRPRSGASLSRLRRAGARRDRRRRSTSPGRPRTSSPRTCRGKLCGTGVMYAGGETDAREVAAPLFELYPRGR